MSNMFKISLTACNSNSSFIEGGHIKDIDCLLCVDYNDGYRSQI